jgi:hypothetical protein
MNPKYFLIAAFLVLSFAGCQKLTEDPKGSLTPVTYFKSASDLEASVSAIYIQFAIDGAWGFTSRMTTYFGAEDLTTDPALNKADFREFDRLAGGSGNGSMVAEWQGPWLGINQANNVLANYQKVPTTDEIKNHAAGQAYFLRALGYYYLVRTFGPVPVITTLIDVNARPERDPVAKVYDTIVNDLQKAKSLLPESFAGQPGKPTKMAATALLADVYLTMAGWPLMQADKYALSATEADAVIQSNKYSLVNDYATVFTTNNNSESVFALQYNIGGGLPQRSFGSSSVPLDEVAENNSSGWDDYYPEINFYLNAPACARTDATFYTTIKLKQPDNSFKLVPWNSNETHAMHPYYKKFRAGLGGDGVSETPTTIISINPSTNKALEIIRYPMVLLDYAEASAMSGGGPASQSYSAINLVRQRAGLPNLTAGLSAEAFRDSVVHERAYEFAGEFGVRWFDIVRLQLLPQVVASRSPLENTINTSDISNKYLAPVPSNEMFRNPAWTQNPSY